MLILSKILNRKNQFKNHSLRFRIMNRLETSKLMRLKSFSKGLPINSNKILHNKSNTLKNALIS